MKSCDACGDHKNVNEYGGPLVNFFLCDGCAYRLLEWFKESKESGMRVDLYRFSDFLRFDR